MGYLDSINNAWSSAVKKVMPTAKGVQPDNYVETRDSSSAENGSFRQGNYVATGVPSSAEPSNYVEVRKPSGNEVAAEKPNNLGSINRSVEIVKTLDQTVARGITDDADISWYNSELKIGDYLAKNSAEIPTGIKLEICRIVKRTEGVNIDPVLKANLDGLIAYYSAKPDITAGPNAEQQNDNDAKFDKLIATLHEVKKSIDAIDHKGNAQSILESTGGFLSGGLNKGLDAIIKLPAEGKLAVAALIGLSLWKIATSPSLRKLLFTGGLVGLGVWGANGIMKQINGKSITQNIDGLARSSDANKPYANYFNIDISKPAGLKATNALMQGLRSDNMFGGNNFSDVINGLNTSKEKLPDSLVRNVKFDGVEPKDVSGVAFDSVKMVAKKFGPESELYKNNSRIKEYWDKTMTQTINWREAVIQLINIDPASSILNREQKSAVDEKESEDPSTWQAIKDEVFSPAAAQVATISAGAAKSVQEFAEKMMLGEDSTLAKKWLWQDISNEAEIASFNGEVGQYASRALNAPGHIFKDASGITYGTYKMQMNKEDFANPSKKRELLAAQIVLFYAAMIEEHGKGFDNNFSGDLSISGFQTDLKEKGGNYYVSLNYTPSTVPREESTVHRGYKFMKNLYNGKTFTGLNQYEDALAWEYFQADNWIYKENTTDAAKIEADWQLAKENMNNMFSGQKLTPANRDAMFTPEIRAKVLANKPFNEARFQKFEALLNLNKSLTNDAVIKKSLDNFIAFAARKNSSVFLKSHGITETYGSDAFTAQYEAYAIKYVLANTQ